VMAGVESSGLVSSIAIVPLSDPVCSVAETSNVMTVSAEQGPVAAKSQGKASARVMVGILMVVTPLK
jgi:hypothetical protein